MQSRAELMSIGKLTGVVETAKEQEDESELEDEP